jgi:hypothetical protein
MSSRRAFLGSSLAFAAVGRQRSRREREQSPEDINEAINQIVLESGHIPRDIASTGGERLFFIPGLLIAFGLIFTGYKIGSAADTVAASINGVQEQLRRIADSIEKIQQDISAIVDLLKRLPAEIAEIIDNNVLRQATVDAITASQFLADRTQTPQAIEDNVNRIEDALYTVQRAVNSFLVYRGATGFILAAQYVATYTQANTLLQRHYREKGHSWTNPYLSAFHAQSVVAPLKALYDFDKKFRNQNLMYFFGLPKPEMVSRFDTNSKEWPNTTIEYKCGYADGEPGAQPNLFRVLQFDDHNPANLALMSTRKHDSCYPYGQRQWSWYPITSEYDAPAFPDPTTVVIAFRQWRDGVDKGKYLATYLTARDFCAPLEASRQETEDRIFKVPPEWQT